MQEFAAELLAGAPAVTGRGEERPEAKLGLWWYVAESGGGVTLGDEVVLRPRNVAAGGYWLKAMAWRAEEVPERVETLRARELQRTPERVPSVHRLNTPREGELGGGQRLGPSRASEDARTQ